jgi:hypothetical protein
MRLLLVLLERRATRRLLKHLKMLTRVLPVQDRKDRHLEMVQALPEVRCRGDPMALVALPWALMARLARGLMGLREDNLVHGLMAPLARGSMVRSRVLVDVAP